MPSPYRTEVGRYVIRFSLDLAGGADGDGRVDDQVIRVEPLDVFHNCGDERFGVGDGDVHPIALRSLPQLGLIALRWVHDFYDSPFGEDFVEGRSHLSES